jgi:hypothetical protein
MKTDQIVENVREKYKSRSELGIKKYGTTLEENNSDNFFKHLQEELMDATLYLEKNMVIKNEITTLIKTHPNDTDLGNEIRKRYS